MHVSVGDNISGGNTTKYEKRLSFILSIIVPSHNIDIFSTIFYSSEKTKVKTQGNNFKQITLLKYHPKPCIGSFVYRNTGKGFKALLCAILESSNN